METQIVCGVQPPRVIGVKQSQPYGITLELIPYSDLNLLMLYLNQ